MSKQTKLCVVNFSELDIQTTAVSETAKDWDGSSRPDKNFTNAAIAKDSSRCEREEMKSKSALYQMTFTFADNSTLSYENNQKDAFTKHNRVYAATGTAAGRLSLYQASGGDSNAFYIRSLPEPDNSSWMGELLRHKPNVTVSNLAMPGSHDAGMYTTSSCTLGAQSEWAITQGKDIAGQLKAGSRYFDFRVYKKGKDLYLGHFGGSGGCYGPALREALYQVVGFMSSSECREAVFLKFSHTEKGVEEDTVKMVKEMLGNNLFKTEAKDFFVGSQPLSTFSGKVVASFDSEFLKYWDPAKGVFAYRDMPGHGEGLRVYDHYSDKASPKDMIADQMAKLKNNGGWGQDYLFLLSFTLTGNISIADVEVLATAVGNPWLAQNLAAMKAPGAKKPNVVYLDFIDPYLCRAIIALNS